ncbi:PTS sugar transporter subunit IIA [Ethanoligenens harbinense]|uniref:PTS sugar transporter subunit IIA n=1 Tax=Ethanoligenens harbinense TaxID=253239 RepID=UPI000EA35FBC|nr:PTS sugar transporter subunit IIA [Ethanoligenens harbinense]AYF40700.1 PTS fructose transporter subunit IIA [Ethanoligenens harbinense]
MIENLLKPESIFFDVEVPSTSKTDAVKTVSKLCSTYGNVKEDTLLKIFMDREEVDSTGFGGGIAIPHAKISGLKNPFVAIIRFKEPVDWDAIDDEPVKVAIALVMPSGDKNNLHLEVLAKLSRKLMDETFVQKLVNETTPKICMTL